MKVYKSFNPYCNGCASRSEELTCIGFFTPTVSILIVMDVLLEVHHIVLEKLKLCFNPYCNGCASRSVGRP